MTTYFSTFISGLGEFIAEQIIKDLDSVEISLLLDGLVVYRSNSPTEKIKHLRYFNNSFQLVKQCDGLGERRPLESIATDFINGQFTTPISVGKSFRVMFYYANSPVAINKRLHEEVENKIIELTKSDGRKLIVDRTNPDFEYWFLYREEGYGFFGLRLTKHPDYKDVLAKGQLRPELANILVLLSDPQKEDIVLDPFTGSGAIPIERAKFPYQKIIASDLDKDKILYYVNVLKWNQGKENRIDIRQMDALDMKEIPDGLIDKIITDPPWGIYSAIKNINLFYVKALREMLRVLKPGGLIVMLVGRNVGIKKILEQFADVLELVKKFDILVSGKKATIFVLSQTKK